MASGLLARSRVLSVCLCLAGAMGLGAGGCGAGGTNAVTVSGKTLTIYVSAPKSLVQSNPQAADVLAAEKLAFQQLSGQVRGFTVRLRVVSADRVSDNARAAIEDSTSAAYLGEILPGASADTVGITNAQDLLQISPTDTAIELTQSTPVIPTAPGRYYESLGTYGHTFARMVPNGGVEAKAVVAEMQKLGVKTLSVQSDGSEYGRVLADAVQGAARSGMTLTSSASSADGLFYAATPGPAATHALDQAAATNPKLKLFASSGLDDDGFVAGLSPAAQRELYVSSPGFPAGSLSSAGQKFVADFQTAYGHPPSTEAIFGYAAMSAALDALRRAGTGAVNHSTVIHDLLGASRQSSVLGTYSIGKGGDISINSPRGTTSSAFVFLRVRAGKLVPAAPGGK